MNPEHARPLRRASCEPAQKAFNLNRAAAAIVAAAQLLSKRLWQTSYWSQPRLPQLGFALPALNRLRRDIHDLLIARIVMKLAAVDVALAMHVKQLQREELARLGSGAIS